MLGRPHIPRLRPPIQSGPYTPDKPLSSFTVSAPARGCIYYGVKGVGEVSICPPMAAIANAVADAIGRRMQELPMSPPKILEALDHRDGPEL